MWKMLDFTYIYVLHKYSYNISFTNIEYRPFNKNMIQKTQSLLCELEEVLGGDRLPAEGLRVGQVEQGRPVPAQKLRRKLLTCSQVKSLVKELTWLLIGSLFSGSQSEARLAL